MQPEDYKSVIDQIVSIHETGKLPSREAYSTATILKDGAGISYGMHQATDKSDALDAIVIRYIDLGGARAAELLMFVKELQQDFSTSPGKASSRVNSLLNLLKSLGSDPLMQLAQDQIFDEEYWAPTKTKAIAAGCKLPISYLVLYDTCIHSGPSRIDRLRQQFAEKSPRNGGDEQAWLKAFLLARKQFLLGSSNSLVRRSVYRVDWLLNLLATGNIQLQIPFKYGSHQILGSC